MFESVVAQPIPEERLEDKQVIKNSNEDIEAKTEDKKAVREEKDGGAVTQDLKDSPPSAMSTTHETLSAEPSTPAKSSFSIPDLLNLNPGFGSRTSPRIVSPPSNRQVTSWRIGVNGRSEAFMRNSSFNWNPLSAASVLEVPMSAMGIGFGEAARTKHVKISAATRVPRLARYVPPARRGSGGVGIPDMERRTSLNDSTHRRLLTDLLKDGRSGGPAVPVEFPESTVIESGKLPSWEERRRIRLARGTAIATVKTVLSPATAKSDMASPGLTRSLVAIAREDREEVGSTIPRPASSNSDATVPMPAKALTSEVAVPRSDIILCKFYHTPGLKCTASPCRFVHEINRTPLNSPLDGLQAKMSIGPNENGDDKSTTDPVEIVEVFRMSGGGRGAGSEWAKAKFRTVPCRDFAAGYCSYGNFCSFVHEAPNAGGNDSKVSQEVKDVSGSQKGLAATLAPDTPNKIATPTVHLQSETIELKPTLGVTDHVKGDIADQEKVAVSVDGPGDSQRAATMFETSAKDDMGTETVAPSMLRPSSIETVVLRQRNPSIVVEERPFTMSGTTSLGSSATIKPNKFKSNNIVVPDYRWSKDQGLVASPSATSLNFTIMSPVLKLESKSTTSLLTPATSGSWADQISPRTVVSPVQYAAVPPPQAWQKPLPVPASANPASLGPDDHAARSGASSEAPDESPFLPITAYSFSTDASSPPATPVGQRQEVVTPDNDLSDLPAVNVYHEAAMNGVNSNVELWQQHQYQEHYAAGSSPVLSGLIDPTSLQPWMVDAYLHQMNQAASAEMWSNPLSSGYGLPKSKFQFAKQLAKQAREGDLPPQVPQSKTNYRTKPCRFFIEGNCPHGDDCSYSHDARVIARAAKRADTAIHKLRTQPCKFYNSAEGCHVGNDCQFLHQYVVPMGLPLLAKPRPWRTKPCRHYAEGKCLAGDKCHFAHVGPVRLRDVKKSGLRKTRASGSGDSATEPSVSGDEGSQSPPVKARKSHSTGHKKKALGNDDIQIIIA